MRDSLTILTTRGVKATKTFRRVEGGKVEKESYGNAKHFRVRVAPVASIFDVSKVLTALESDAHSFVIRGEPLKSYKPDEVIIRNAKGGAAATFGAAPDGRRWVMIDVDKAKPPRLGQGQVITYDKLADWVVRTYLPSWLHGVTFHYQWSSSMLMEPNACKVHLWFFLTRPVAELSIVEWAKGAGKGVPIDRSLFSVVQAHYTAAPIFEGLDDPLKGMRSGLFKCDRHEVEPPAEWLSGGAYSRLIEEREDVAKARKDAAAHAAKNVPHADRKGRRQSFSGVMLERASMAISGADEGNRHATIAQWAFTLGGWVGAHVIAEGDARQVLNNAMLSSLPKERHAEERRNINEALEAGQRRPFSADEVDAPQPFESTSTTLRIAESPGFPSTNPNDCTLSGFDNELVKVGRVVHDAPHLGHDVPTGFYLTRNGLGSWTMRDGGGFKLVPICPSAVLIAGRCIDIDEHNEHLLITWPRADGWQRRKVTRQQAFSKSIVGLADHGLTVPEKTAPAVGQFLCAYEAANIKAIPTMHTTTSMGWQDRGHAGFCIGYTHFDQLGVKREIDINAHGDHEWSDGIVALSPTDSGEEQYARGFTSSGTYEGWLQAAQMLNKYPRAKVAIIASLAAPLLEIIQASPFVLEYSSNTSRGKTTAIRVAAAVWGVCEDQNPRSVLRGWDMTTTAIERLLAFYRNIPVFLDDTRRSRFPETIPEIFYMVVQGQGRARGSLKGTSANKGFRTILISTGEEQTSSLNNKAGAKARTLEITNNPLNTESEGDAVLELERLCKANFGHAGPRWVQWLIQKKDYWPKWRLAYQERRDAWKKVATSGAEGRLLDNLATLDLTWLLAEECLGLGLEDPLRTKTVGGKFVFEELVDEVQDVVGTEAAIEELATWYIGNRRHVHNAPLGDAVLTHQPSAMYGWYGYYGVNVKDSPDVYIGLSPKPVDDFLKSRNLQPRVCLRAWRDAGILLTNKSEPQRMARKAYTREGDTVNVYTFPARVLERKSK